MTRRKHSRPARDIAPVHPHAAAVDIGATLHVAAVRPGCDPEPVRTFGTFTTALHRLAAWFEQCVVETVAMEATGVYWADSSGRRTAVCADLSSSSKASAGVLHPSVLRGRPFSVAATAARASALCMLRSVMEWTPPDGIEVPKWWC